MKVGLSTDRNRILVVSKQALSQSEVNALRKAIEEDHVELQLGYSELPTYPVIVLRTTIGASDSAPC